MKLKIEKAVLSSNSIKDVLTHLNIIPVGGNYHTITKWIKVFEIDISHFKKEGWNKGRSFGPKRSIDDYLSNKHYISSDKLRRRLIKERMFEHICSNCNLTDWNHVPIPLELDHKDGDHFNNNLSNLQLLCPNCHAQTPTYRGRNIGKKK